MHNVGIIDELYPEFTTKNTLISHPFQKLRNLNFKMFAWAIHRAKMLKDLKWLKYQGVGAYT